MIRVQAGVKLLRCVGTSYGFREDLTVPMARWPDVFSMLTNSDFRKVYGDQIFTGVEGRQARGVQGIGSARKC